MPLSWNLGTLTSWNPLGHSRPVTGLLYLYLIISLTSSSSCLCRLPRITAHSPSTTCSRWQFLRKIWPIQLTFRLVISCTIFLSSLTLCNTASSLTIGSTDLVHPSPAPHFQTCQVFLIYFPNYPIWRRSLPKAVAIFGLRSLFLIGISFVNNKRALISAKLDYGMAVKLLSMFEHSRPFSDCVNC